MRFVAIFWLFFSITGFAQKENSRQQQELPLLKILSEPEKNLIHHLSIRIDDQGNILEVIRTSKQDSQVIQADELLTREVVLARSSGRDAVLLSCAGCNQKTGGRLKLRYLFNGITGKYGILPLDLQRQGMEWEIYSVQGEFVRNLTLKSRKVFGQIIGIDRVLINHF